MVGGQLHGKGSVATMVQGVCFLSLILRNHEFLEFKICSCIIIISQLVGKISGVSFETKV